MDGNAFARRSKMRLSEMSKGSLKRPFRHSTTPSRTSQFSSPGSSSHPEDETKSTTSSLDSLEYKGETGLAQFLRLRREAWKVRLGSLKINKRLLATAFKAWTTYQDSDPKPTTEQLKQRRITLLQEEVRIS